jgi:hypothetical protein
MDYIVTYNNELFRYLIHIVSNKFKMHKNYLKKYFISHMICVEITMIESFFFIAFKLIVNIFIANLLINLQIYIYYKSAHKLLNTK